MFAKVSSKVMVKKSQSKIQRIWEIDTLRGTAVIGMVIYHLYFNLTFFHQVTFPNSLVSLFSILGWLSRITFVVLVGITIWLRFIKCNKKITTIFLKKSLLRTTIIGTSALLISLLISIFYSDFSISFGILHFISLAIIFSIPFVKFPKAAGIIGTIITAVGFLHFPIQVTNNYLFIFGFYKPPLNELDYFPLIPWFGIVLLGIYVASQVYENTIESKFNVRKDNTVVSFFSLCGQHSLFIYIVHQPIIVLLLKFFSIN